MRRMPLMLLWPGLVVIAVALAACGGDSSSDTASPPAGDTDLITTTPAGTLELDKVTWNLPYEPSSIDPAKTFNYAENTAIANLVENLLRLMPDFTIEPGLAESFTNPSPTTWVYKIRQGVTFWDGEPMTADDVVYSLQRNMDPDVGSFFAYYYANVEKIEKTGDFEVTVTLKKPDVLFNEAMATPAGAVVREGLLRGQGRRLRHAQGRRHGHRPVQVRELAVGHVDDPRAQRRLLGHHSSAEGQEPRVQLHRRRVDRRQRAAQRRDRRHVLLPAAGRPEPAQGRARMRRLLRPVPRLLVAADAGQGRPLRRSSRAPGAAARHRPRRDRQGRLPGTATPARVVSPPVVLELCEGRLSGRLRRDPCAGRGPREGQAARRRRPEPRGKTITLAAQGSSIVHSQTADILKANAAELGINIEIKIIPVQRYGSLYWDPKAQEGIDAFLSTWYGNVGDPLDLYATIGPGGINNYNALELRPRRGRARCRRWPRPTTRRGREHVVNVQTAFTDDNVWLPLTYQTNILIMNKRISGAVASFPYLYYPWAASIGGVRVTEGGQRALDYPEFLRRLPKAELHVHLESTMRADDGAGAGEEVRRRPRARMTPPTSTTGSPRRRCRARTASSTARRSSSSSSRRCRRGCTSLHERDEFARIVYETLEDEQRNGNLRYREMFFSPMDHLVDGVTYATIVDGLVEGVRAAERDLGVTCRLVACINRAYGPERARELVELMVGRPAGRGHRHRARLPDRRTRGRRPSGTSRRTSWPAKAGLHRTAHVAENSSETAAQHRHRARPARLRAHRSRLPDRARPCHDRAMRGGRGLLLLQHRRRRCRPSRRRYGWGDLATNPIRTMIDAGLRVSLSCDSTCFPGSDLGTEYSRGIIGLAKGPDVAREIVLNGVACRLARPRRTRPSCGGSSNAR